MRIDMKRDAETAKRKGLAGRTIFAVVALVVGFGLSYLITTYLFNNEILTDSFFYNQLFIPRTVSEGILRLGLAFVMVFVIQFFAIIAYAVASPEARVRPGTPTAIAQDPDYYEVYTYTD
jgi:hypothetical protein